jgi:nickel/cobalt transporter (NiCoT) family protein
MSAALTAAAPRGAMRLLYGGLLAFTALAWLWAAAAFHAYPGLLGMAVLAYTFGLRHAVDADHIAAIDNVTRKLMQAGQRPIAVGLYFSLGHATVVLLASSALAGAASATRVYLERFRDVIGTAGTVVSVALLFLVAVMNASILAATLRMRRRPPGTADAQAAPGADLGSGGGLLACAFQPLFALITRSWQMCLIGFLFGLGFDTATEIGVLGLSAAQAAKGLPIWSILVFPVLFAAGMSLLDTLDSTLMVGAYGWAFVDPRRKVSYNILMLSVSVAVALLVGGAEALGLLADRFHSRGPLWGALAVLNERIGAAGYLVIALFLACWLLSLALHRIRRAVPAP